MCALEGMRGGATGCTIPVSLLLLALLPAPALALAQPVVGGSAPPAGAPPLGTLVPGTLGPGTLAPGVLAPGILAPGLLAPGGLAPLPTAVEVEVEAGLEYVVRAGRSLLADVYYPVDATDALHPAVVLVHGGAFVAGRREVMGMHAAWLAAMGFVAVTIDYRLATEAAFPAAVRDVEAAVGWVRDMAGPLGVDPDRIALLGGSAGAYLAAMAVLGEGPDAGGSDPRDRGGADVAALVTLGLPSDLAALSDSLRMRGRLDALAAGALFFGASALLGRTPPSPVDRVRVGAPPTLALHGGLDLLIPPSQSSAFVQGLLSAGSSSDLVILDDAPHDFWHRDPWAFQVSRRIVSFLQATLSSKPVPPPPEMDRPVERLLVPKIPGAPPPAPTGAVPLRVRGGDHAGGGYRPRPLVGLP